MEQVSADKKEFLLQSFKGGLFAFILCTVLVLILALLVKLFNIPSDALPIVNQVLKGLSVAVCVYIAVKPDRGFFKGLIAGLLFSVFFTALFALLGGKFSWAQVGLDTGIGMVLGAIVGGIASSRKSR